jgi:hypothetical protein
VVREGVFSETQISILERYKMGVCNRQPGGLMGENMGRAAGLDTLLLPATPIMEAEPPTPPTGATLYARLPVVSLYAHINA